MRSTRSFGNFWELKRIIVVNIIATSSPNQLYFGSFFNSRKNEKLDEMTLVLFDFSRGVIKCFEKD